MVPWVLLDTSAGGLRFKALVLMLFRSRVGSVRGGSSLQGIGDNGFSSSAVKVKQIHQHPNDLALRRMIANSSIGGGSRGNKSG